MLRKQGIPLEQLLFRGITFIVRFHRWPLLWQLGLGPISDQGHSNPAVCCWASPALQPWLFME